MPAGNGAPSAVRKTSTARFNAASPIGLVVVPLLPSKTPAASVSSSTPGGNNAETRMPRQPASFSAVLGKVKLASTSAKLSSVIVEGTLSVISPTAVTILRRAAILT